MRPNPQISQTAIMALVAGRAATLAPAMTSLSFDCPPDCSLPAKTAVPLALITAELVSNSLKYAYPTGLPVKISLSWRRDEKGDLAVIYEDDGVGFPEDFDMTKQAIWG